MFKSPPISSVQSPGSGSVILSTTPSSQAIFSTLNYSYPLKLLSPSRYFGPNRACLFCLTYVGLLGGDQVNLTIVVEEGAMLVLLTQGSTKVFKARRQIPDPPESSVSTNIFPDDPSAYPSSPHISSLSPTTRQTLRVEVQAHASLFLLPSPITCFTNASYAQSQRFDLASSDSNLLVLDSLTSGRMERGEEWKFKSFVSTNEVWVAGKRIIRDRLCLEDTFPSRRTASADSEISEEGVRNDDDEEEEEEEGEENVREGRTTSYLPRVAPYSCYATLLIHGPALLPLLQHLTSLYASISHYPQSAPYSLLWSFSRLEQTKEGTPQAGILRIAGATTEEVREFIKNVLEEGDISELLGRDLWNTCWIG